MSPQQEQEQDPHEWLLKMLRRVASKNELENGKHEHFVIMFRTLNLMKVKVRSDGKSAKGCAAVAQ